MLPESEIGKNIRRIRRERGLTLDELAHKTGITKGYLSKVETSDKAPPVSTLINIAEALGLAISALFGEPGEPNSLSIVRAGERQIMARDGTAFGYSFQTLAHKYPNKSMEPYILTIPAEIDRSPLFQHKGEEMMLVLEGAMRFLHGENEYLVKQGDCVYFDSGIPHRGFSDGDGEAKCLMVIYTP